MITNKYRYNIIDGSWLLKRNCSLSFSFFKRDPENNVFTPGKVLTSFIQSINKFARDYGVTADKVIICWDMWDGPSGYYTSQVLAGEYKDDRKYYTEADLDNPDLTDEQKKEIELEVLRNDVQRKAKYMIKSDLWKYGIPSIYEAGYEADQIVWVLANMLNSQDKPSIITSADSDWSYLVTPNVDYFKAPLRGAEPKILTYAESVSQKMPEDLVGKISLYDYKSMYDSLESSHNAMRRTRKEGLDTNDVIRQIVNSGDYSGVEDLRRYNLQLSTFDISQFPKFQKVLDMVNTLDKIGGLAPVEEFRMFSDSAGMTVSDSYYMKFRDRLDPSLYRS